jgi:hypothetical protein
MNCSRFAAAGIAAMALGVALPSVASAEDYCVPPNYDCGPNNVQKLQDALNLAASTPAADRVILGEGTYVAPPVQTAFSYNTPASPVEIVGAGRGRTILTAEKYAVDRVLYLNGAAGSSVRDLTIRIPQKASPDFRGLLTSNTARRIEIIEDPDQVEHVTGAELWDGVLEDSTVELSWEGDSTGVKAATTQGASVSVRGSTVTARTGVDVWGHAAVERSRISGGHVGVLANGGETKILGSLVRQLWNYGTAIKAQPHANWNSKVIVDGVTVVGANTADVGGIFATTSPAPSQSVEVSVANSVIRDAFNSLAAVQNGTGTAKISASYSDYNPAEDIALGGAQIDESHVTNVGDGGFADPSNGDYRLRVGSPLVDRGDPDAPQGLDLDGNALVADGNGDGFARRDLGAFELQPQPQPQPQPQADTQAPLVSSLRARRVDVSYKLSETARVIVKVQRRLAGHRARYRTLGKVAKPGKQGANRLKLSRRIRAKDVRPGRYRAVIVAVDAAGNRSAPKAATFRVSR